MNLFDFLYRGATVYVAAGQIYAEAESRANLFALPRRNSICGPEGRITQKPRAEQIYLLCRGATVYAAHKGRIAQKPRAEQIYLLCRGSTVYAAHKGRIAQKPRAEQIYLLYRGATVYADRRAELRRNRDHSKFICFASGATAYAASRPNIRKLARIRIEFGRIMQAVGNERRCAIVFHIRHGAYLPLPMASSHPVRSSAMKLIAL